MGGDEVDAGGGTSGDGRLKVRGSLHLLKPVAWIT